MATPNPFAPISIHDSKAESLVFLGEQACAADSRKRAMVFVDRARQQRTNLVAFNSTLEQFPLLAQLRREQAAPTRMLQDAQTASVNALRQAYGREDWVVGDWRAYQACLQISSRLKAPLRFEVCGKGAGSYEALAPGRKREDSKFDIKVVNEANDKYFWLEASGNHLSAMDLNVLWVQKQKMAWALAHPNEKSLMALVHGDFDPSNPEPVDGKTFIKYLTLDRKSYENSISANRQHSTLDRALITADTGRYVHEPKMFGRANKSGVPEEFMGFNALNCPAVRYGENINLRSMFQELAAHLSDGKSQVHVSLASAAKPDLAACAHILPPRELLTWAKDQMRLEQRREKGLQLPTPGRAKVGGALSTTQSRRTAPGEERATGRGR